MPQSSKPGVRLAELAAHAGARLDGDGDSRWDGQSVHAWDGVYGDYLTAKVAKVFPQLAAALRD